jgi:hypothetical protein
MGPATFPTGANATPALLAAYFDSTDKVFVVGDLAAGTFTVPEGKTLAVVGDVTLTGASVIDAYDGTFDLSAGTIGGATATFIVRDPTAIVPGTIKTGTLPSTADPGDIDADTRFDRVTLITGNFAIGGQSQLSATEFATVLDGNLVYIKGKLSVGGASDISSDSITVLGPIEAGANLTVGGTTVAERITATAAFTLTDLADATGIRVLDTGAFTVTSGDATVDLDRLYSTTGTPPGKLSLTASVTQVDIGGGNGNIDFNTSTPAFGTAASNFGNTGTTVFNAAAGSASVNLTFAGPVEFKDDFTRTTGGAYIFGGDVTIADGETIVLGGTDIVTLGSGAKIKVGANDVLEAMFSNVVLTPVDGAVLTATVTGAKLGVSTQAVEIDGTVVVYGELEATDKDITVAQGSQLAVAAGGKLTTADSVGDGAIVLGDDTNGVTLAGAGSWTASGTGAAIVLTQSAVDVASIKSLSLSGGTSTPGVLTASGTPTITVLKGTSAKNVLTLGAGTEIALEGNGATVGTLELEYDGSNAGCLLFGGAGAKVSTALASGTTKVTDALNGGDGGVIAANVGADLEVFSTVNTGNGLKLGSIAPKSGATYGAATTLSGATATANTALNGVTKVTS